MLMFPSDDTWMIYKIMQILMLMRWIWHFFFTYDIMRMVRLLVQTLLTDAYGADHTLCMVVADDYHGPI